MALADGTIVAWRNPWSDCKLTANGGVYVYDGGWAEVDDAWTANGQECERHGDYRGRRNWHDCDSR